MYSIHSTQPGGFFPPAIFVLCCFQARTNSPKWPTGWSSGIKCSVNRPAAPPRLAGAPCLWPSEILFFLFFLFLFKKWIHATSRSDWKLDTFRPEACTFVHSFFGCFLFLRSVFVFFICFYYPTPFPASVHLSISSTCVLIHSISSIYPSHFHLLGSSNELLL